MALESKELMTVCLRKVSGLSRVKLIDAVWIWTEPHSMRLKIKLTVQKEVVNGAVLQQASVVEFVIRNQQCKACEASFAQGNWHAIVQVRQRVLHKRTFFFLEQLILKHESHMECIKIEVSCALCVLWVQGHKICLAMWTLCTWFMVYLVCWEHNCCTGSPCL
jgi:nonsense-mediated mRNA decay protein 3